MKTLFRLVTIIFTMAMTFSIAELGIRAIRPQMTGPIQFTYDVDLGAIPVPYQKGKKILPKVYDYTYLHNSYGLRNSKEFVESKQDNFRILFLGDSFVYGIGVNDDQTFCHLVEKKLLNYGWDVEVINAGMVARGTDYCLKFLNAIGYKFKPDLVALCFFRNDFEDNEREEYYTFTEDGRLVEKSLNITSTLERNFSIYAKLYNRTFSRSHLASLFKKYVAKLIIEKSKGQKMVISYRNSGQGYVNEVNKKLTEEFMMQFKREMENNDCNFIVFYIPSREEVDRYRKVHEYSDDEKALTYLLQSHGTPLFSLTATLASSEQMLNDLYYLDSHWTSLAHSLAASFMVESIKKNYERK